MGTDTTKHLTAEQVAERLGISRYDVYQLAKRDAIPHLRIGRRVRFRLTDLERWEATRRRGGDAETCQGPPDVLARRGSRISRGP
jgi:excisionase family DNA binding protein